MNPLLHPTRMVESIKRDSHLLQKLNSMLPSTSTCNECKEYASKEGEEMRRIDSMLTNSSTIQPGGNMGSQHSLLKML